MNMEANLQASFLTLDDRKQATEALLLQGIIELRPLPPLPQPTSNPSSIADASMEWSDELVYPLQVWVEKSRFRQAEATILQCGGTL